MLMLFEQAKALLKQHINTQITVREYELICLLRTEISSFPQQSLTDPLILFKSHFIIRHLLYQIRNEWRVNAEAELYLSALYIEKTEWVPGAAGCVMLDKLAEFYLNLANLENISVEEVTLLMNGFWDKYQSNIAKKVLCGVLEVPEQLPDEALVRAWRKASLKLHPDKGGDIERFKQVQSAYDDWRHSRA